MHWTSWGTQTYPDTQSTAAQTVIGGKNLKLKVKIISEISKKSIKKIQINI
jgi:hypothetical protein